MSENTGPGDVARRVRSFVIKDLAPFDADGIKDDTPLLDGLLDSGELMRLVVFLEEEFGVEIDDTDVVTEHFATVRDIDRLVVSKLEFDR